MIGYGKKKYCSRGCYVAKKRSKYPYFIQCEHCKKDIKIDQAQKKHKYCSPRCAALARHQNPEYRKKFMAIFASEECRKEKSERMTRHLLNPDSKLRQAVVKRMKENNPSLNPQTREKMSAKLRGRTFLSRGGNGKTTVPQEMLAKALGWEMETAIGIANVPFQSPPTCYKVDIGNKELKIAIEVDGNSHKTKKWKFLDKRKTEILNYLGWSVLRFWNKEILEDLNLCVERVNQFIALKSRETTTSTQMAC
jgi:very-short-patch-repair endonuclease